MVCVISDLTIYNHYRSQLAPNSRWYPWWYLTCASVAWDWSLVWVTWQWG